MDKVETDGTPKRQKDGLEKYRGRHHILQKATYL